MLQAWMLAFSTITLEDSMVVASAGVTTAAVVVLVMLLSKHRQLVSDASKSSRLAKDLWNAMNVRLATMDTRIVDLMAKVEVYSVKSATRGEKKAHTTMEVIQKQPVSRAEPVKPSNSQQPEAQHVQEGVSAAPQETGAQILRVLSQGPKTSTEIKQVIGRSREHTARLMKELFELGFVIRNDKNRPYVYEITERGKSHLIGS